MDQALALPARRISDLLSSGLQARAKSRRETMDQPRVDPDQELVTRRNRAMPVLSMNWLSNIRRVFTVWFTT